MCFKSKLPHPREKPNYNTTLYNVNIDKFISKWFYDWQVPEKYADFWNQVKYKLSYYYDVPACAFQVEKEIYIRPEWCSAGVIAHENAHISWNELTKEQESEFFKVYQSELISDYLMIMLDRENDYMNTSPIEAHAEVYRYLGSQMPESLKTFYPKLF